jgi:hypothetical protein
MNDFTMQDLEEIQRCLRYMITGGVTPYSSLTIDISQKINRMLHQTGISVNFYDNRYRTSPEPVKNVPIKDEYCKVSGVKLGFNRTCDHEFTFMSGWKCIKCGDVFP